MRPTLLPPAPRQGTPAGSRRRGPVVAVVAALVLMAASCSQSEDAQPSMFVAGDWKRDTVSAVTDDPVAAIDGVAWLRAGGREGWALYGRSQKQAGGFVKPALWTTPGGKAWTPVPLAAGERRSRPDGRVLGAVDAGEGGVAVLVGSVGLGERAQPAVWRTEDLEEWDDPIVLPLPDPFGGAQVNGVAWFKDRFFAAGGPSDGTEGGRPLLWTSLDGRRWDLVPEVGDEGDGEAVRTTFVGVAASSTEVVAVESSEADASTPIGDVREPAAWSSTDGSSFRRRVLDVDMPGSDHSAPPSTAPTGGDPPKANAVDANEGVVVVAVGRSGGESQVIGSAKQRVWTHQGSPGINVTSIAVTQYGMSVVGTVGRRLGIRNSDGKPLGAGDPDDVLVSAEDASLEGLAPRIGMHEKERLVVAPAPDGWVAYRFGGEDGSGFGRADLGDLPHTRRQARDLVRGLAASDTMAVAVGEQLSRLRDGSTSREARLWVTTDGKGWNEHLLSDRIEVLTGITSWNTGFVVVGYRRTGSAADPVRPVVLRADDGTRFARVAEDPANVVVEEGRVFVPDGVTRLATRLFMFGTTYDVAAVSGSAPDTSSAATTGTAPGAGTPGTPPNNGTPPTAPGTTAGTLPVPAGAFAGLTGEPAVYVSDDATTWLRIDIPIPKPSGEQSVLPVKRLVAGCGSDTRADLVLESADDGRTQSAANVIEFSDTNVALFPALVGVVPTGCVVGQDNDTVVVGGEGGAAHSWRLDATKAPRSSLPSPGPGDAVAGAVARGDGFWLAMGTSRREGGCATPRIWSSADATTWSPNTDAVGVLRGTGCGGSGGVVRWKGRWLVTATVADAVVGVTGP